MPARAAKELRTLLLPAGIILAATVIAAALSGQSGNWFRLAVSVATASFFLGTPLLAAWSLGSEYHQRTIVLLLTQPVSRSRVWLEKWLALVSIGVLLFVIQVASLEVGPFEPRAGFDARLVLWVAAMLCSVPLWTLVARSTVGGFAFGIAAATMLELAASFITYEITGVSRTIFQRTPLLDILRVLYAAVTFAAGWWMFTRLQAAKLGHAAGDASRWTARIPLLQYGPRSLTRNLFITELHLHRPTWLVAAGFVVCWLAAVAAGLTGRFANHTIEATLSVLLAVYIPIALVLSSTLSLSEDATLGVHGWRLTWPTRAWTQWALKLASSLLAGLITLVVIPYAMVAVVAYLVWDRNGMPPFTRWQILAALMALVLLGFWAAAVFRHTIRAAVAGLLLLAALALYAGAVPWRSVSPGTDLIEHVLTSLMRRWHVPPDYFSASLAPDGIAFLIALPLAISVAALVLSLRAFRRVHISRRSATVHVGIMAAVMLLGGTALLAYGDATSRMTRSRPVMELRIAAEALATGAPSTRQVTQDELRHTGRLSPDTQQWLEGSTVTMEPTGNWSRGQFYPGYLVRLQFPGEREYRFWIRTPYH